MGTLVKMPATSLARVAADKHEKAQFACVKKVSDLQGFALSAGYVALSPIPFGRGSFRFVREGMMLIGGVQIPTGPSSE